MDIAQHICIQSITNEVYCFVDLDGHLDYETMIKAVELTNRAFPLLFCKFVEGHGKPYWEETDKTAADAIDLVNSADREKEIYLFTHKTINKYEGPQLSLKMIRNSENDYLCFALNHMIGDGAALKDLLYFISSVYSNLKQNPGYQPKSAMGDRSMNKVFKNLSFGYKLNMLTKRYNYAEHDNGVYFKLEGDDTKTFLVVHRIPAELFKQVKAYAKRRGATVNDILLAAYVRSLYKAMNHQVIVTCMMDMRKYLKSRDDVTFCDMVGNISCHLGRDIGASLAETLNKVKNAMHELKDSPIPVKDLFLLSRLYWILPYKLCIKILAGIYVNPIVTMTNIGIIDKNRLVFDGVNIKETFITSPARFSDYLQLAVTTYDNRVTLSSHLFGTQHDKRRVEALYDNVEEELRSAVFSEKRDVAGV